MPLESSLSSGRTSGSKSIQAVDTQSDGKSYEQLRQECLQRGVLFEDQDFPATDSSLFFSQSVPVNIEWKRPTVRVQLGFPSFFIGTAGSGSLQASCELLTYKVCAHTRKRPWDYRSCPNKSQGLEFHVHPGFI